MRSEGNISGGILETIRCNFFARIVS